MRERKLQINLITYNSAITALSKASRREARKSAREHAPQRFSTKHGATVESFDIDELQLWKKALHLLDQMRLDGIEPDGFSYSATISCCGAGGRWQEALSLIEIMQNGNPRTRPNKIAYTAAICTYSKVSDLVYFMALSIIRLCIYLSYSLFLLQLLVGDLGSMKRLCVCSQI
jgi:pentatricopeptide repeat protein